MSSPEPRTIGSTDGNSTAGGSAVGSSAAGGTADLVSPVLAAVRALNRRPVGDRAVVLIDGPSGAGKSTLADAVVRAWPGPVPPTLVRLDDIYPGWGGLDAATAMVHDTLLTARSRHRPAGWRRYDWATGSPAEWHAVDPDRALLVEGCGAFAGAVAGMSDVRVWLDADDDIRKQRALARDGGVFEEHWDQWQLEWAAYLDREQPQLAATVRLTGTHDEVTLRGNGGASAVPRQ